MLANVNLGNDLNQAVSATAAKKVANGILSPMGE
jgi:hypothetical protein